MQTERRRLANEVEGDKKAYANTQMKLQKCKENVEQRMDFIRSLEEKLASYDAIIEQGDQAFQKITSNSGKLATVLNEFSNEKLEQFNLSNAKSYHR